MIDLVQRDTMELKSQSAEDSTQTVGVENGKDVVGERMNVPALADGGVEASRWQP